MSLRIRPYRNRTVPLPPEVAEARFAEQRKRTALASNRAYRDLARRYRGVYHRLYEHHVREIDAERGPLPGDDQSGPLAKNRSIA